MAGNVATPGYIPSNVFTKKESGYTTKGNAEKTRRTDNEKGFFGKTADKIKAKANNAAATVFGDRAIDYSQHSDEKLQEMIKKNPKSADAVAAQRELNKRNEAAGMATKAINVTNAQGGTDDMRFSTGNTLEDAANFGYTKAKDVPQKLTEMGKDPSTTSIEEASSLLKTDNPERAAEVKQAVSDAAGYKAEAEATPETPPETLSTGIATDEPTEDLSTPSWLSTDEAVENIKNSVNEKAAASPEMKSILKALKDGDIDKGTAGYFIANALSNFANDMGNIKETQRQNSMWANLGNQKNPEISGTNDWQEYLKTDWKEAQKLKNEAKSKQTLGNIDNQLEVSKQRGFDQYLANEKPDILKSSQWAKMAKEDPNSYAVMMQLGQMVDGKTPLSADQLGNLIDAAGNAKLGNDIGAKQLEQLGLTVDQAKEALQALKFTNELNNATKQYQINAAKYGAESVQAQNALTYVTAAGQKLDNTLKSKTMNSNVRKALGEANNALYGQTKLGVGPVQLNAGSLASAGQEGSNLLGH